MVPKPSTTSRQPRQKNAASSNSAQKDNGRPPPSLNGADWVSSDAKKLLVQDMLDGLVPVNEKIKDIEKLFNELYAHQPEFRDFPFDKERYKTRIERLQTSVQCLQWGAQYDKDMLVEARKKFPKPSYGPTGVINWQDSDADHFLELDMEAGKHLEMKPSELRDTRECYKHFSKKRFSKRIDQKREAAKPYGMNPMQAAAKKQKKSAVKVQNRPEISRAATQSPYNNS
jgi:hypothetical protein